MRVCGGLFDLEAKRQRLRELQERLNQPDIWRSTEASRLSREYKELMELLDEFERLEREVQDIVELSELMGEDESLKHEVDKLVKQLDEFELKVVLSGEYDRNDAILSIHPGAGGTESCDWAAMLFRMYVRWAERKGYGIKVLQHEPGEVAGIKAVTMHISGPYAYGYLKAERGVHRLVRISPFDASRRRHTSFAACQVYPYIEEDLDVEIDEKDLRIETFRASGPGGQYVNVTDSAVRITHIPTGIVVSCQSERSQYQNKMTALRILKMRLYQLKREEQRRKLDELRDKSDIGWGYEIRSYVLHPYKLVKDHRTGYESTNPDLVLDGEIDDFIRAYLLKPKDGKK